MKTATVTAYIDTGFTGINIPDSPALMENNLKKQLDVINCLPLSGEVNTTIRVKAYDELHATDYVKMVFSGDNTTYWAKVNGYKYLTSDTVEISLTMDYWLTMGGINNISSISGITQRVHVAKADDDLFAFTEPDEMINPAKPLVSVSEEWDISSITQAITGAHLSRGEDKIIILSTLDLFAIGKAFMTNKPANALTLSDGDPDNPMAVTIPNLFSVGDERLYDNGDYYSLYYSDWGVPADDHTRINSTIVGSDADPIYGILEAWVPEPTDNDLTTGSFHTLTLPNVGYFDASDPAVRMGISIVHDCGVEDALLEQYLIPSDYISAYRTYCGRIEMYFQPKLGGMFTPSIDYEYGNHQVRNKKVFSGACNAYTVYAKANSDMETFNPEKLAAGMSGTGPAFRMFADLRKQGGAMCTPMSLDGRVTTWYMNFVKELEFQNVPIKFEGASGSLINQGMTYMSMNAATRNFQQEYPLEGNQYAEAFDVLGTGVSAASGILGGVANMISGNMGTGSAGILGGFADIGVTEEKLNAYKDLASLRKEAFQTKLYNEKTSMDLKNTYVAPQIKFQASQTLRELVGNGFIILKYQLQDSDLERCDKLLTMYGYRHSKSLEKTDLTNRPDFNYIEAGEVHITPSVAVPKWVREGAEDQLVGARIWHKAFDPACYEDNE